MNRFLIRVALTAIAVAQVAAVKDAPRKELDALLAKARAACGIEAFERGGKELVTEGAGTVSGVTGRWTIRNAPDGRFRARFDSRLPQVTGFDGKTTWNIDGSGIPSTQVFERREHVLLEHGLTLGSWCAADGPLVPLSLAAPASPDVVTVRLRARDGVVVVELDLDAKTLLPKQARYDAGRGLETWTWSDWRSEGGLAVPREFVMVEEGAPRNVLDAEKVELAPPGDVAGFAVPTARPDDVSFDASATSRLAGKLARTRHLLVKARVDGSDATWFIFDSGAGSAVLSDKFARELALEPFGEYLIGGAGAERSTSRFYQARELVVGPVTMRTPRFSSLDMTGLESAFGEKLSGIVGYDLLQRVVASVDMGKGTVDLFDPAKFARDGVTWRELSLHGNHPHVRCTFAHDGDEEGIFRLDTGAPGVSVLFHSPFVKSLGLENGQETAPFRGLAGVGGESKARLGKVDWFELGGVTIDTPSVIFVEDEKGALADPWTAGTIGGGLLDRFDLILDYPHGRVGFVQHDAKR